MMTSQSISEGACANTNSFSFHIKSCISANPDPSSDSKTSDCRVDSSAESTEKEVNDLETKTSDLSNDGWNISPHLRILLLGTISSQSPLRKLRGLSSTIIKIIFNDHIWTDWKNKIIFAPPNAIGERWLYFYFDANNLQDVSRNSRKVRQLPERPFPFLRLTEWKAATHTDRGHQRAIVFPPFTGININMMPFIMGDKSSLPEEYHSYWPILEACDPIGKTGSILDGGKIGYLTIHETDVIPGSSQRRRGMHTESPGMIRIGASLVPGGWGAGQLLDPEPGRKRQAIRLFGGIYMASNVADSCMVWPCLLEKQMVGEFGDCQHLRPLCGKGETLGANELVWMTDATPHESLPLPNGGRRQYFRLVAGGVSVWYSHHSTTNRLGIKPNAIVLANNKFTEESQIAADSPILPVFLGSKD